MTQRKADLRAQAEEASATLPGLLLSAERLAATIVAGSHAMRRAGSGEDFWQYRPATVSDTARNIDWRRSARSDLQFVRDREAQSPETAAIWISAARGMSYRGGADRPTKRDRARLLALAVSILLLRGGERVGVLGHAARGGGLQAERLAELILATPESSNDNDSPPTGWLRNDQRVLIFADFLDETDAIDSFIHHAAGVGVRGVLVQILDPDEDQFPFSGSVLFQSPSGALRHHTRDAEGLRAAYLARLAERREWLRSRAAAAGWHFGYHVTDHAPAVALNWLYQALED